MNAPLWVDNQGIIQVGGIAAAQGATYPYISIRDQTGLEMGRIGASINKQTGLSGDNAGSNPPASLTAGAWFTQLAIGGNNLSNWNVLITPDTTRPLGSLFQMRNIYLLTVDYAAQQLQQPYNAAYRLEFGSSAWVTSGGGSWQFPGIRIYEVEGGNQFGAYYISRGVVLRGTAAQSYQVLASLVTFNGQSSGIDSPQQFWAELAMYSPLSTTRTVYLTSGGPNQGSPTFLMYDVNNNLLFEVDTGGSVYLKGVLQGAPVGGNAQPVNALAYNVNGYGAVIDAQGNWKGKAITSSVSQTPWTQSINGNGWSLTNTGAVQSAQFAMNNGTVVIDGNGAFVSPGGINVRAAGIACGAISTFGGSAPGTANGIDTQTVNCNGNVNAGGTINSTNGYTGGSFRGAGVSVGGNGISCGALSTLSSTPNTANGIDTGTINSNGNINCAGTVTGRLGSFTGAGVTCGTQGITCGSLQVFERADHLPNCTAAAQMNMASLQINGTQRIDGSGIYRGSVQWSDYMFGSQFGIYTIANGLLNGGFYDRDGNFHNIRGGLITS